MICRSASKRCDLPASIFIVPPAINPVIENCLKEQLRAHVLKWDIMNESHKSGTKQPDAALVYELFGLTAAEMKIWNEPPKEISSKIENELKIGDAANHLPITGIPIPAVDIEAPILSEATPVCACYQHDYHSASIAAEKALNYDVAKLYRSLSIVCSFSPNYQDVAEPYHPFVIWEGKRSAVPEDLSEADLDTVALLFAAAKDPALRARLGDVLWVRRKDHNAARQAVADYIAASTRLLTPANWVNSVGLFHRSLQLAAMLGRKDEAWWSAETNLLAALANPLAQTEPFYARHLLEIAFQMEAGNPAALARQAGEQATKAAVEKDPRRVREYRLLEEKFHKVPKKVDEEARALISKPTPASILPAHEIWSSTRTSDE
jgi:hypothetical protein